jgi:EmrB/QacA subfamily drug resistance transporter
MFMEMFDGSVILTALPAMAASFAVSPLAMGIGVTGYLLALAAVLPACGWIADRFGTRRVFMWAIATFALASVACGLSQSLEMFTAARVVQGTAAALMSPVARIAMLKILDRHKMIQAMNIGIMAALIGPTVGPPIGGFIATYWSWHWIFFINVPIAILGLLLTWRHYPDLRAAGPRLFDWRGAALNALAMLGVIYGLQLMADSRHDWRIGVGIALGGAACCVLALRHARRFTHPLLSLESLHIPSFKITVTAGFITRVTVFGPVFMLPLLLQLGLGMSAFMAGVYILISTGADVLAKLWIVASLRRYGHRRIMMWSAVLYPVFPLGLIMLDPHSSTLMIVLLMIYGGFVRSYQMTAINSLCFADISQQDISNASPLVSLAQQTGMAIAVALATVAINLVVSWRGAVGVPLQRGDFAGALLLMAVGAWLTVLWYRSMPADAGARASGYQPRV